MRHHIAATSDVARADPAQINQVIINLITNAAQAMADARGVIEVRLEDMALNKEAAAQLHGLTPGHYVRLTVRDTGPGIAPTIMGRIFDPYFTTKEVGNGTGMGLAVVHGIVKNHGGAISVQSGLGAGASFHVYFPVLEVDAAGESPEAVLLPLGHERILFIDDEPALGTMGQRLLQHLGYEVITETSSLEALALFTRHPDRFDLVITDMTMPQMTGKRLAQEMLRMRPDIPIILCTGFSEHINEEEARALGLGPFL